LLPACCLRTLPAVLPAAAPQYTACPRAILRSKRATAAQIDVAGMGREVKGDWLMYESGLAGRPLIREHANIVPVRGERVVGQRVVPIGAAPAVGLAQLTYRGGPLIARVKVYSLYWGSAWAGASLSPAQSQPPTRSALDAYMAHLVTSSYM